GEHIDLGASTGRNSLHLFSRRIDLYDLTAGIAENDDCLLGSPNSANGRLISGICSGNGRKTIGKQWKGGIRSVGETGHVSVAVLACSQAVRSAGRIGSIELVIRVRLCVSRTSNGKNLFALQV